MSKRLMPTYLVNFLKEIYDGTIPSNFGERMVSRQFIASVKELYETLGGTNPSDYSRRMVNEYLIKFFNEIEIVEYTDDDVKMTKDISSDLVYPACRVDAIGGMSYKCNNLWSLGTIAILGGSTISINDIGLTQGTYTIKSTATKGAWVVIVTDSSENTQQYGNVGVFETITFVIPSGTYNARIYFNLENTNVDFMLNSGSTALPYQPYFTGLRDSAITSVKSYDSNNNLIDTYIIPSEIQALEGYGRGINSTVYNNVDFASGKYIKKVGVVDLGSLTYNHFEVAGLGHLFRASLPTMAYNNTLNLLCANYTTVLSTDRATGTIYKTQAGTAQIDIIDNSYTDADTFKSAMDGVLLYYDLATPVETNISENAPLLECEEGGTIVFKNEYNQNMPNEVTTWIKGN